MSERKYVRFEVDGPVATLTVDRPDALNALNADVLSEIKSAVEEAASTDGVRCMVVTGAGKAFVAGADIASMKSMGPDEAKRFAEEGHRTLNMIESLPCPVIAAVNGFALGGGCELALACDFIYASEKAKLGQPEVKLGVIPGFGGTQRLARRVGVAMARELVYTGAMLNADEALRIGLVNRVVAPDELLGAAHATATTIAEMGPLAVTAAKRAILEGEDRQLEEANAREIDLFAGCFSSEDQKEGMDAFLAKRKAEFKGR
jgi:enoyl-CoA hydratase